MNRFTGRVPPELSKLSLLQALYLSDNALEDEIPQGIFQLKHLTILKLQNNQFRGPIVESHFKLKLLSKLDLSRNNFNGSISRGIFEQSQLTSLDLSHNNFTGSIPGTVMASMKSSLLHLNLSHNSLSATIPEDIGTLETLEVIDISNNDLSGTIPTTLKNCKNLLVFNMSGNKLSGPLQDVFTDMKFLTSLKLSQNQISGNIPSSLASLKNLSLLDLSWNHLQGEINWLICISIAEALAYLHSGYGFPIIHCDLKPSNILLDEDWQAHVGDFGTARMLGVHINNGQSISSASAFEGTIGYMAPEFAYMRTVSTKVDIFSFGVIIMEFVTKQRPTNLGEENGLPVTLNYIVERAITEHKVLQVIDPALLSSITEDQEKAAEELLKLALLCTSLAPEQRPDISPLLNLLKKLNVQQS